MIFYKSLWRVVLNNVINSIYWIFIYIQNLNTYLSKCIKIDLKFITCHIVKFYINVKFSNFMFSCFTSWIYDMSILIHLFLSRAVWSYKSGTRHCTCKFNNEDLLTYCPEVFVEVHPTCVLKWSFPTKLFIWICKFWCMFFQILFSLKNYSTLQQKPLCMMFQILYSLEKLFSIAAKVKNMCLFICVKLLSHRIVLSLGFS